MSRFHDVSTWDTKNESRLKKHVYTNHMQLKGITLFLRGSRACIKNNPKTNHVDKNMLNTRDKSEDQGSLQEKKGMIGNDQHLKSIPSIHCLP